MSGVSSSGADRPRVMRVFEDADAKCVTILLDDGATFEVAPDAPEVVGLRVGEELPPDRLDGLKDAADRKSIARRVFGLLDRKLYSRARLRLKLVERGHEASQVDQVLDGFAAQGLLDDLQFSLAYTRDQLRRRPVGRAYLRKKLREYGVADRDVAVSLDQELDDATERDLAAQALARRAGRLRLPHDRDKAMRFLLSRGFSRGICADTVRAASSAAKQGAE